MGLGVTVVLVNWNGENYLRRFLPHLMRTTYKPFYVLLVDNNSEDGSIAFINDTYPEIRVFKSKTNLGFAAGNNFALPYITTPYAVLLNTDVLVPPNWLDGLVALAEANPLVAAIQPKILAFNQPNCFEYAGAAGGWIDKWGYPFCRGRIFDTLEEDKGQYDQVTPIFWASGACMLVRMEIVEKIGLFDPYFFAHWEEIDFCWRAQNYGYTILIAPQSVVWHIGGGTLAKTNPHKTFLNFRNSLLCLLKNLPLEELFIKILIRFLLDYVALLKNLASGKIQETKSILRAHYAFLKCFPVFWKKRKHLPQKKLKTLYGVYNGSIVWQYFIRSKTKFYELQGESQNSK